MYEHRRERVYLQAKVNIHTRHIVKNEIYAYYVLYIYTTRKECIYLVMQN